MSQSRSILVLGGGELGMAVLRGLARQVSSSREIAITALLRPQTIPSQQSAKRRNIAELLSLGVKLAPGDLVADSAADLAAIFRQSHTVIGCTGFIAGSSVQRKLCQAVLAAGVKRYVPWQFGVDYDAIGRNSAQGLFDEQLDVRDLLRSQHQTE